MATVLNSTNCTPPSRTRDADAYDGPDLHQLLTVDEVATLLKVSRSWVYEHTRARKTPRAERLPHIKLGKYVRFHPAAVRAFLVRKGEIC